MPTRLQAVESVLGVRIDEACAPHMHSLISAKVEEGDSIDFKREPYKNGEDLALDVVALANGVGGVIVIGIDDMRTGHAEAATPVALNEQTEIQMRQWIHSYVSPFVQTEIHRIEDGQPNLGFYVVVVPRSPLAPHAARNGDRLLYRRRDGPRNRSLTEAEIADTYRARFMLASNALQRIEGVRQDGEKALRSKNAATSLWLWIAMAPAAPGQMGIGAQKIRELKDRWLPQFSGTIADGPFRYPGGERFTTGVRRIICAESRDHDEGLPRGTYLELHADGSCFVARQYLTGGGRPGYQVLGSELVLALVGAVRIAVDHATSNALCSGDALARCGFSAGGTGSFPPLSLGYLSHGSFWNNYSDSRLAENDPLPIHTISLDAIALSNTELLVTARTLGMDFFQSIGVPEVHHITEEGELRRKYLVGQVHDSLLNEWAPSKSIVVVEGDDLAIP